MSSSGSEGLGSTPGTIYCSHFIEGKTEAQGGKSSSQCLKCQDRWKHHLHLRGGIDPWPLGLQKGAGGDSHPCTGSGPPRLGSHGDTGMHSCPLCPRSHHGCRHLVSPDTHSVLEKNRQCGVPRTLIPVFPNPLHAAMVKPEAACKPPIQAAASTVTSQFTLQCSPLNRCSQSSDQPTPQPRRQGRQSCALPKSQWTEPGSVRIPLPYIPTLHLLSSPLTHASPAWQQLVPSGARAAVAAGDIDAVGTLLAGALPGGTFIRVWEIRWGSRRHLPCQNEIPTPAPSFGAVGLPRSSQNQSEGDYVGWRPSKGISSITWWGNRFTD